MALPRSIVLAFKCVPVLIKAANERRTVTYGQVGEAIGHPPFFMGQPLGYVRDNICAKHNLPQLTALVVDAETGLPGDSFLPFGRGELSDEDYREIVDEYQAKVYDYPRWDETWANLKRHYGYEEK